MTLIDQEDRIRALDDFAGATSQPAPVAAQSQAIALMGGADRVYGAQPVAVHRDETRVLQRLAALGAAAGDDWYYRFPVKNRKKGTTDYIEGPSIKLANDLARLYGNCAVRTRVFDLGGSWMIYAMFIDYETGFELERPFQQNKGGAKLGGDDDARRLDIALQIGVSKASRNVVVNALQTFADYAFNAARNSLVEKIGKNLIPYRDRTVQGIGNLGVQLDRVELVIGKSHKEWTAPDIARVIALMKGIADGMATIDETFPPKQGETVDPATGEVKDGAALNEFAKTGDTTGEPKTGEQPAEEKSASEAQPATSDPAATVAAGSESAGAETGSASPAPASAGPTNEAEYKAYANAWIAEQTNAEETQSRWVREKKLRAECGVSDDTYNEIDAVKKAKVTELKKAK